MTPSRYQHALRYNTLMFALVPIALLVLLLGCSITPPTEAPAEPYPTEAPLTSSAEPAPGEILVSAAREASYKATYKLTGTSDNQRVSLEQTWYVKQTNSRLDIGNGYSLYRLNGQLYQCYALTTGSTCIQLSVVQASANRQNIGQLQMELLHRLSELEVEYESDRIVIGQPTFCLAMKPLPDSEFTFKQATVCYTANGVPLFAKLTNDTVKLTMEAQSLTPNVSDSDLALPAPIR